MVSETIGVGTVELSVERNHGELKTQEMFLIPTRL
jgi:hypothetical protein